MRRVLAPVAALLVAACQVDVEGAICHVPGATSECPAGQACGNDLRCSERALACETAGTRCELGTALCAGADGKERVERCTDAVDRACGTWAVEECTWAGFVCGTSSGAPGCECPPYDGAELAADPVAGSRDREALPFPTGAATPPACRFGRLGDALEAASDALDSHQEGTSVRAYGDGVSAFGDVATGETFPLIVASGVALYGAVAPAGPTIIRAEAATGTGIALECAGGGAPRIEDVTVVGGGSLTTGIAVLGGDCAARLARVDVSRVNGAALAISADAGSEVVVTASAFHESAVGIHATSGRLVLGTRDVSEDGVDVIANEREGILLKGGSTPPTIEVEIHDAKVAGNGGTGVVLDVVSTASKLMVRRCDVHANGDDEARRYGQDTQQRVVGGIFVRQSSLSSFVFEGNRLWSNAGDQLAFESSGTAWSLANGAIGCGGASNLFACIAEASEAIGIAGSGSVKANYSVWPGIPWDEWTTPGVYIDPDGAWCGAGEGGAPAPPATCPTP